MSKKKGARVASVLKGSPAARAGVRAGETLLEIDGHAVRDVLDYRFYGYDGDPVLRLGSENGDERTLAVSKPEGADLGLSFETYLMDSAKACSNKCIFCFIDQLPRGLRDSLYFKDDDARLSFLQGNYISLTNLSDRDVERMIRMRISPVNVSVHTTNPALRNLMLGNKNGARGLEIFYKLCEAGLSLNCQIVVCPGVNDREELSKTLRDLTARYPAVSSISVVPVGVTRFREGLYPLVPVDGVSARDIIERTERVAKDCLETHGTRIAFLADEIFLRAGFSLPGGEYYEDYPQFENGVGLITSFREEFNDALADVPAGTPARRATIATGMAAAPFLSGLLDYANRTCHNLTVRVVGVPNNFFGETVDVAGLVTGADLLSALLGRDLGERVLIPALMLRHGGDLFLDGTSLSGLSETLGVPVVPVENTGGALVRELFQ